MSGTEYPHIDTLYKRHMDGPMKGRIIVGDYTRPEFAYLASNEWVGTEKVDGTNIRVMWAWEWDGPMPSAGHYCPVEFGGKTDNAQIPAHLVTRLRQLFDGVDIMASAPKAEGSSITLYGEGYGARIQKGGGNYKADGCDFVLFDIRVGSWWLQREAIEEIAFALGIGVVPIVWKGTLTSACDFVAQGFESSWGPFAAEGLVLKPAVELMARNGDRLITKIKTVDFRQKRAAR